MSISFLGVRERSHSETPIVGDLFRPLPTGLERPEANQSIKRPFVKSPETWFERPVVIVS